MTNHKIAMLTAGGLAPCLSSAVAALIERYTKLSPDAEMIGLHHPVLLEDESAIDAVVAAIRKIRQHVIEILERSQSCGK